MERYTNPDCKPEMEELMKDCPRSRSGAECWLRLCDIEDILGDNYDLDRLRELAQADREGRCVVLPCKIGQKVYDITSGEVIEKSVVSIPFLLSKSINHLCLHAINQRDAITEIGTQDFGKTVFFTRAEAEAALRREQDG